VWDSPGRSTAEPVDNGKGTGRHHGRLHAVTEPQTREVLSAARVLVRAPGAVLSEEEAARRLGIELVEDVGRRCVTVPRSWSHVVFEGWSVVRRDLPASDVLELADGTRVTQPARTVADLVGGRPLAHAVASADSALRVQLVTAAVLTDVLLGRRSPARQARRQVAALMDPRSGSVLESLLRVLLITSGLPSPLTQYEIRDRGRFVARVDFCWPGERLIVEADGFAFHSDRAAYRKDRERMNQLERLGWRVLRFTWEDIMSRPGYVVGTVSAVLALAAA
jgi:hypothetical protein